MMNSYTLKLTLSICASICASTASVYWLVGGSDHLDATLISAQVWNGFSKSWRPIHEAQQAGASQPVTMVRFADAAWAAPKKSEAPQSCKLVVLAEHAWGAAETVEEVKPCQVERMGYAYKVGAAMVVREMPNGHKSIEPALLN